jgi:DNA transformation protein
MSSNWIGEKSQRWLAEVGIESLADLKAMGAVEAFKKVKAARPREVTLNMLWGLYGAEHGIPWNSIPPELKEKLKKAAGI